MILLEHGNGLEAWRGIEGRNSGRGVASLPGSQAGTWDQLNPVKTRLPSLTDESLLVV